MSIEGFCGLGLHFTLDGFRLVYVEIALLMWAASGIFSREYMAHYRGKKSYYAFFWATFLATVGVFLSADLYTTFIFFEIMSFTSFVWVIFDQKEPSVRAAKTYLAVAVIGGLTMLMGLFLLYDLLGTLEIRELRSSAMGAILEGKGARLYVAGFLLLFGFGAKAGCFPLHIWLPKAHPVAPAPASAVLSGVITKSGVLALVRVVYYIAGPELLAGTWVQQAWMVLSLLTVFMGSMLAYREKVLKKRLAYSTVSQVSYILFGLSLLNPTAFVGAMAHVVFHSLVKNALFLAAGAVIFTTGWTKVEQMRGLGKVMPVMLGCYAAVSLSLVGIPPFSGFISKWYLAQGALASECGAFSFIGPVVLLISALLTAGYLLPLAIDGFFPGADFDGKELKERGLLGKEPSWQMLFPMAALSAGSLLFGCFPGPLLALLGNIGAALF